MLWPKEQVTSYGAGNPDFPGGGRSSCWCGADKSLAWSSPTSLICILAQKLPTGQRGQRYRCMRLKRTPHDLLPGIPPEHPAHGMPTGSCGRCYEVRCAPGPVLGWENKPVRQVWSLLPSCAALYVAPLTHTPPSALSFLRTATPVCAGFFGATCHVGHAVCWFVCTHCVLTALT